MPRVSTTCPSQSCVSCVDGCAVLRSDIYRMLLDHDEGNYRDIDFADATWPGVIAFLNWVLAGYSRVERCSISRIETRLSPSADEAITVPRESLISGLEKLDGVVDVRLLVVDDEAIIQQLQIGIQFCKGADKISFCELTFFPEHINLEPSGIHTFIELVEEWQRLLQASMFYVRYGNESWHIGDASVESGVIFTSQTELA